MKDFADDGFKFHENGRQFSKGVKNTERLGGTARYEQFLLFPVFKRLVLKTCKTHSLFGKELRLLVFHKKM